MYRQLLLVLLSLTLLFGVRVAHAAVSLCVTIRAKPELSSGFEKLVRSEIARHPSHRIVSSGCESQLVTELFDVEGVRYVTMQMGGEPPVRRSLGKAEEYASTVSALVTETLRTDPAQLSADPARWSAVARARNSVLVRGVNRYRLELFETMMRTDRNVAFAPGVAMGFARGADHWEVGARVHFSGLSDSAWGNHRALRLLSGLDAGLVYETSQRSATSAYFGAGAGLLLLRLDGMQEPGDSRHVLSVNVVGAAFNLRAGVRFLRIFDFDAESFVQGSLPLFATRETDVPLFGENGIYTPFLQAGIAVGF